MAAAIKSKLRQFIHESGEGDGTVENLDEAFQVLDKCSISITALLAAVAAQPADVGLHSGHIEHVLKLPATPIQTEVCHIQQQTHNESSIETSAASEVTSTELQYLQDHFAHFKQDTAASTPQSICTETPQRLQHMPRLDPQGAVSTAKTQPASKTAPAPKVSSAHESSTSWCSTEQDGKSLPSYTSQGVRLEALGSVRRYLTTLLQPVGVEGFLSNAAAVQALQQVLPFADLLRLASESGDGGVPDGPKGNSSSSKGRTAKDNANGASCNPGDDLLLTMLPPALRAWLLADTAAAVLLSGDDRRKLPETPQHCTALKMLLHKITVPQPNKVVMGMFAHQHHSLEHQQQAEQKSAWPQFKQAQATYIASAIHISSSSSSSSTAATIGKQAAGDDEPHGAAGLLAFFTAQLLGGRSNGSRAMPCAAMHQQHKQALLPTDVAHALADMFAVDQNHSNLGSSNSSGSTTCSTYGSSVDPVSSLQSCLASMGAAALHQLEVQGQSLGLNDIFLQHQQVLLETHLIHTLLPLQQATPPSASTAPLNQRSKHSKPSHAYARTAAPTEITKSHQLHPEVLSTVLGRVKDFVLLLADCRQEQQAQVLPQLQGRLKQLTTAIEQQKQQEQVHSECAEQSNCSRASNTSSSTNNILDQLQQEQRQGVHIVDSLSTAELLGFGNLQLLLELERQTQQQSEQQVSVQQAQLQENLAAAAPGSILDLSHPVFEGLECQLQQQHLLQFWSARADMHLVDTVIKGSPAADGSSSFSSSWEQHRIQELLQKQAGCSATVATDFVAVCHVISVLLKRLEEYSASAAGRGPVHRIHTLSKAQPDQAASSSCSSSSSIKRATSGIAEPLPGIQLKVHLSSPAVQADNMQRALRFGPLAWCGMATVLVKAVLSHLPGQTMADTPPKTHSTAARGSDDRMSDQPTAAAATVAGGQQDVFSGRIKLQLCARLEVLADLAGLLTNAWDVARQQQEGSGQRDQHHRVLQHLLQYGFRLSEPHAAEVAAALHKVCDDHIRLLLSTGYCQEALQAATTSSSSNLPAVGSIQGRSCRPCAPVAAALAGVMWGATILPTLLPCVVGQLGLQRLLLQYCCSWMSCGLSRTPAGFSSRTEARFIEIMQKSVQAKAAANQIPEVCLVPQLQPTAIAAVLDAVEFALCVLSGSLLGICLEARMAAAGEAEDTAAMEADLSALQQLLCNKHTPSCQWQKLHEQYNEGLSHIASALNNRADSLTWIQQQLTVVADGADALVDFATAAEHFASLLPCQDVVSKEPFSSQREQPPVQPHSAAVTGHNSNHTDVKQDRRDQHTSAAFVSDAPGDPGIQKRRQLCLRLPMLSTAVAVAGTIACHATELHELCDKLAAAAADAKQVALSMPADVITHSTSSSRAEVTQLVQSFQDVFDKTTCVFDSLASSSGVLAALTTGSAAAGLGVLASMGLWTVPSIGPVKPVDLEDFELADADISRDSGSGASIGPVRVSNECMDNGRGGSSSSAERNKDDSAGLSAQSLQAMYLLDWTSALQDDDLQQLAAVLLYVTSANSGSSSSGLKCTSGAAGSAACRVAHDRLSQLLTGSGAGTAMPQPLTAKLNSHTKQRQTTAFSSTATTQTPAVAAAPATGPRSAACESFDELELAEHRATNRMHSAVWQLLLAVKPSMARALHCHTLPAACRSYETLEMAVLGWPPQAAAAAALAAAEQQSGDSGSSNSNSTSKCACRKPGFLYAYARAPKFVAPGHTECIDASSTGRKSVQLQGPDTLSDAEMCPSIQQRVVCAAPSCVARELHVIAQHGKPYALQDHGLFAAQTTLEEDMVRPPAEFRHLMGAHAASASKAARPQQQQYARAMQMSFSKAASISGLVRRLLFLEAIREPAPYSILHPALYSAWLQQHMLNLGSCISSSAAAKAASSSPVPAKIMRSSFNSSSSSSGGGVVSGNSSGKSVPTKHPREAWLPELAGALMQSVFKLAQKSSSKGTGLQDLIMAWFGPADEYPAAGISSISHSQRLAKAATDEAESLVDFVMRCLGDVQCRASLCCWVLAWHHVMTDKGADYGCSKKRAAAAEATSDLLGSGLLSHIRLPAWYNMIAAPQSANSSIAQSSSTSSSLWALSGSHSRDAAPCDCDYCGSPVSATSSAPGQHNENAYISDSKVVPSCSCFNCGVARHCSSSCAAKDKSSHKQVCKFLSKLAQSGGFAKSWNMLKVEAAQPCGAPLLQQICRQAVL